MGVLSQPLSENEMTILSLQQKVEFVVNLCSRKKHQIPASPPAFLLLSVKLCDMLLQLSWRVFKANLPVIPEL